jgi:acetyl esterase/lipase
MNLLTALGTAILALASPNPARVERNLTYAPHERGGLDVYIPRRPISPDAGARRPIALFIYGGSWQSGEKAMYAFVGRALAARGIVTVVADYRLYPGVVYPEFLRDNAEAAAFVKLHAADWGADPGRFYLIGHSAGAYNVAMLALDKPWLAAVGLDPKRDIAGVIGLSGPYDFLPLRDETLKVIFGPPQTRAATQPITYASGDAPPLFLVAGTGDKVVDPGNATRLAAAVAGKGGQVESHLYPGVGHVGVLLAISPLFGDKAPVLDQMLAFMDITPAKKAARDAERGASGAPSTGAYAS